jgi:hypothetical protein
MRTLETQTIHRLFREFLRSEAQSFPPIRGRLEASTDPGVYLIYDPRGRVAHVGRTLRARNGLHKRLKDHLHGNSSFTNKYLNGDSSKLRQGYKYKYLVIPDSRERALVEALAVGTLCPLHLGLGKANQ